jgi:hypothetical protein
MEKPVRLSSPLAVAPEGVGGGAGAIDAGARDSGRGDLNMLKRKGTRKSVENTLMINISAAK